MMTTFETAAENLRITLPLMSKNRVPIVPLNYAVWYAYVAGNEPTLKERMDGLLAADGQIDEVSTRELHAEFLDRAESARIAKAEQVMRDIMRALADSVASTGDEVIRYEHSLSDCVEKLSTELSIDALRDLVAELVSSTHQMRASSQLLQAHLEKSQREADALRAELVEVTAKANTDALTGLANRHAFEQRLAELNRDPDEASQERCVIVADIDKFKSINDTYGHLFGDKILKTVAATLSSIIKGKDLAARFGGEEFVVLLPSTPPQGAMALAESIRASIERKRIFNPKTGEELRRITVSLGAANCLHGETIEQTLARADEALYRAKANGRNRTESSFTYEAPLTQRLQTAVSA